MDFYKPKTHPCAECNMPMQVEPTVIMVVYSVKTGICRCTHCYGVFTIAFTQSQKPKQTV